MAEKASVTSSAAAIAITVGEGMNSEHVSATVRFFENCGPSATVPQQVEAISLSNFVRGLLKVDSIERGRLSCLVSVKPPSTNIYGGMHGGAVASVAERLSIACARTVVGRDKELFLGELSISYLSAAPLNSELKADASVIRSGRNLTVVGVEFRNKDSGVLAFTSRATFYNMPASSL
ncbi:uncharacterized protein LOC127786476 isoform X2 [Diospyros lotus]|uniref:uncharacterized protein LOC127786476 isoform X2 n=1 Tax=Diospyros lotus TaxID=55363 RepID=UPI0022543CB5|nr:uncharacterized protein LOC127786476 isoform X2 [Diospyros lotus]